MNIYEVSSYNKKGTPNISLLSVAINLGSPNSMDVELGVFHLYQNYK